MSVCCAFALKRRYKSMQIFGGVKEFAWISLNMPEKFLCDFAYKFSPTRIMKTFFLVLPPKKGLHEFFCKRWAPFLPGFLTN